MTEAEWLACEDADPLLAFLGATASQRKLRLFAVACCRRQPTPRETGPWAERAEEAAEQFCDGQTDTATLRRAQSEVESRLYLEGGEPVYQAGFWACSQNIVRDVKVAAFYAANNVACTVEEEPRSDFDDRYAAVRVRERNCQCKLLRDIFGNPFRPVAFNPAWHTSDVAILARGIYEEKAFDRMPILADALQDAGCEHPDILDHCRDTSLTHVRGCWVVDLVLGKE